jgi:hypothetical protein
MSGAKRGRAQGGLASLSRVRRRRGQAARVDRSRRIEGRMRISNETDTRRQAIFQCHFTKTPIRRYLHSMQKVTVRSGPRDCHACVTRRAGTSGRLRVSCNAPHAPAARMRIGRVIFHELFVIGID